MNTVIYLGTRMPRQALPFRRVAATLIVGLLTAACCVTPALAQAGGGGMATAMPADPMPHSFNPGSGMPAIGSFTPDGTPRSPMTNPGVLQRVAASCRNEVRAYCPGVDGASMPHDAALCLKDYRATLTGDCRSAIDAVTAR